MIKSELIDTLASEITHLPEHLVSEAINCVLETMGQTLIDGGRIEIRGFGSFALRKKPPRHAHNPKTGQKIKTQSRYSPHFKPGKELRERVNESRQTHPIKEN